MTDPEYTSDQDGEPHDATVEQGGPIQSLPLPVFAPFEPQTIEQEFGAFAGDRDNALCALIRALAKAQGEFAPILKTRTASIRPRDSSRSTYTFQYADMEDIRKATTPALAGNGLALTAYPRLIADERHMTVQLLHAEGGWLKASLPVPGVGDGLSTEVIKAFGGLLTYLRRYLIVNLLNLSADNDLDDDDTEPGDGTAITHPDLKAAKSIGELSRVMSGFSAADKRTYSVYFNQRQNDMKGQA